MKSLNTALVSMSAAALTAAMALGCGNSSSATADSSKAATSSATSAKPIAANSATPSSTASAATVATSAPVTPGPAAGGDSLKFMPKTCEEGRVFVNLGKLLSGDVGKAAEGMQTKLLSSFASSGKPGDDKAAKVLGALKDGGIEPVRAVREIAVCAGKGDAGIIAVAMDFSGAKGKPADVFAKAMEAATGKAPKKEDDGGVTYLTNDKNKVLAFVSPTVVVTGATKDAIKAIAKGGDGAADFGQAASFVIWAKVAPTGPGSDVDVTLKDAGADYELKAVFMPPGPDGAAFKKDPDSVIKKFNDQLAGLGPQIDKGPFSAAGPALKNAKLSKEGDRMALTTVFPQAMVAALATAASQIDTKQLMHGF